MSGGYRLFERVLRRIRRWKQGRSWGLNREENEKNEIMEIPALSKILFRVFVAPSPCPAARGQSRVCQQQQTFSPHSTPFRNLIDEPNPHSVLCVWHPSLCSFFFRLWFTDKTVREKVERYSRKRWRGEEDSEWLWDRVNCEKSELESINLVKRTCERMTNDVYVYYIDIYIYMYIRLSAKENERFLSPSRRRQLLHRARICCFLFIFFLPFWCVRHVIT